METKGRRKISARKEYAEINRIRRAFERKLESRLARMFSSEFRKLRDSYETTLRIPDTKPIGDQIYQLLIPHYREVITTFGQRVLDNLEIKFDFDRYVNQYVSERGSRNIVGIGNYVREKIRRRIALGVDQGLGVSQIGKSISELGVEFSSAGVQSLLGLRLTVQALGLTIKSIRSSCQSHRSSSGSALLMPEQDRTTPI